MSSIPVGSARNPKPASDEWSTKELMFAAYLKVKGHEHTRLQMQGQHCYWVYSDPSYMQEDIDTFTSGEGEVEPQEFNRAMIDLKREMFAYIDGIKPNKSA